MKESLLAASSGGLPQPRAVLALQAVVVLSITVVAVILMWRAVPESLASPAAFLLPLKQAYWHMREALITFFSNPMLSGGFVGLLALSLAFPASRKDRVIGKGLALDFVWMLLHAAFVATFITAFLGAAHGLLDPWTQPIQRHVLAGVPAWLQVLMGYLLIELLGWFSHLLRHKVQVLWVFHEVHHSQREMNAFTLFRVHPVDYLMAEAIILLPSVLFHDYLGIALTYLGISRLHDALNHSNLRTNLGWLRFVFVTPQSHRVHHSVETDYHDMNFGVTLCLWDRLFGTHSPSDFVYPATGVPDAAFPGEGRRGMVYLPATLLQQLVYPFSKVLRMVFGRQVVDQKP